jgi:hypothetical protein
MQTELCDAEWTNALAGRAVAVPQSQLDLRPSGIVVALVGYLGPSGLIP